MIFYIHGLHKLEGWIAFLQHGTRWTIAEEVAGSIHIEANSNRIDRGESQADFG